MSYQIQIPVKKLTYYLNAKSGEVIGLSDYATTYKTRELALIDLATIRRTYPKALISPIKKKVKNEFNNYKICLQ